MFIGNPRFDEGERAKSMSSVKIAILGRNQLKQENLLIGCADASASAFARGDCEEPLNQESHNGFDWKRLASIDDFSAGPRCFKNVRSGSSVCSTRTRAP
jgi:hypothetical protein